MQTTFAHATRAVTRKQHRKPRIGVLGLGLTAFWSQFKGMKARVEHGQRIVEANLGKLDCEVVSAGLVDCDAAALRAASVLCKAEVDLIILYLGTYGTGSLALRSIQKRRAPVLVLNLQAGPALDYDRANTEDMLVYCSACVLPEISHVFARARIGFNVVSGTLEPSHPSGVEAWERIGWWIRAAQVVHNLQTSRVGFLGHTYPGMLDMYSDFTAHQIQLGTHIEILEMCDLQQRVEAVQESEVEAKLDTTRRIFEISKDSPSEPLAKAPSQEALAWSARVACGLDRMVEDFNLDGLAYYYRGANHNEYEKLAGSLILGNSLLTARGIPCAGEGDLKTCFAMYVMDILGVGGSYTEFYAMDLNEQFMLMAHDGPGHIAISDRKPILRGLDLFHGKSGSGISVEFNVKTGPVTILGMTQTADGRLKLVAAEGESIPGPILRIGNTNSRIRFSKRPTEFIEDWTRHGPIHHVAMGIGRVVQQIEYVARLLNLELVVPLHQEQPASNFLKGSHPSIH